MSSETDNELTEEFLYGIGFYKTRNNAMPYRRVSGSVKMRANVYKHHTVLQIDRMFKYHLLTRVYSIKQLRMVLSVLGIGDVNI